MKKISLFLLVLMMTSSALVFAGANIKLRVVAVNPSEDRAQKVPIKINLPKEVTPADVVDSAGLEIGYDSERAAYYAYSDSVELKPKETRVFEVEISDVWRVPDEQMNNIRTQTARALKHLENTEYFGQAKGIVDSIERRMTEIQVKQDDDTLSREEHIGAYRVNQVMMAQIKQDVQQLEKLLQHTGAPPSIEFLKDTVFEEKKDMDRITAWRVILGIVGFLGVLGAVFFARWFLAVKAGKGAGNPEEVLPAVNEHVAELLRPAENAANPNQDNRKAG